MIWTRFHHPVSLFTRANFLSSEHELNLNQIDTFKSWRVLCWRTYSFVILFALPQQMALIIPFRNRYEQISIFLRHIHPLLRKQYLDYRIFSVEQVCLTLRGSGGWGTFFLSLFHKNGNHMNLCDSRKEVIFADLSVKEELRCMFVWRDSSSNHHWTAHQWQNFRKENLQWGRKGRKARLGTHHLPSDQKVCSQSYLVRGLGRK